MISTPRLARLRAYCTTTNFLIVTLIGVMILSSPVAAGTNNSTSSTPAGMDSGGGTGDYEDILKNLYEVAKLTLKYAGIISFVLGGILWTTAGKQTSRAYKGVRFAIGGAAMTGLYFGIGAVVNLIQFIAGG